MKTMTKIINTQQIRYRVTLFQTKKGHEQIKCTPEMVMEVDGIQHTVNATLTFTLCRSIGFMIVPWKNSTVVKCLLNNPSSSKSGGFLHNWIVTKESLSEVHRRHTASGPTLQLFTVEPPKGSVSVTPCSIDAILPIPLLCKIMA